MDEIKKPKLKPVLIILIILYLLIGIFYFVFSHGKVVGRSMYPTLDTGDMVLGIRYSKYNKPRLKRGDVIVFKSPFNSKERLGKRIIGIPGDEILIEEGKVYLNGEELEEEYIREDSITRSEWHTNHWIVPEGKVFVMGDNRQKGGSSDSRSYGFIDKSDIKNRYVFIYYPFSERWGFIK